MVKQALRQHVSSGSPYESVLGSCRAVRVGNYIAVAGTAPIGKDGRVVALGDVAAQARRCLEIIEKALSDLGSGLSHVVRTRLLLTQMANWEVVARVHGEYFRDHPPANTIMQTQFADPQILIEIEADAVVSNSEP
jgi:enamine deaminase RidA (YjgF/YER057c/UK114 family)